MCWKSEMYRIGCLCQVGFGVSRVGKPLEFVVGGSLRRTWCPEEFPSKIGEGP